jgi:hypothetical protein
MNTNQTQDILPSVTDPEAAQQIERLASTKKELVALLSLSPVTLWRSEKRSLIHAIAGIRHKLYSVAEVKRFLDGRAQT